MKSFSFIMFKPDALERELVDVILERFKAENFTIEAVGCKLATEELILTHYEEPMSRVKGLRENALNSLTGKYLIPVIVSLENEDAIEKVTKIVGKTNPPAAEVGTIRRDFGEDSFEKADKENRFLNNLIHRCDDKEAYNREIKLWFNEIIYNKYKA